MSRFFCPARDFEYTCKLDKQHFESTVTSRTNGHGWNRGETTKITTSSGVGVMGGAVIQFTFTYSWQDSTATAYTDQQTTVEVRVVRALCEYLTYPQSVELKMQPSSNKCVLMTTQLHTIEAEGEQTAYINATNYIGLHQDPSHHWKSDNTSTARHYYRLLYAPYAIARAKNLNIDAAKEWMITGDTAALTVPITHTFSIASSGRVSYDYFDAASQGTCCKATTASCLVHPFFSSSDCTKWDPAKNNAALQAPPPNDDGKLPVIDAIRIPV